MIKCAVYGCVNNASTTDPAIQFYFFPKHPAVVQQWINACCLWQPEEININTARICSIHFDCDSYSSEYKMVDYLGVYTKVLKYDAVPTLYLPQQTTVTVIKSQLESPPPAQVKQIIVYGVAGQEHGFETSFGSTSLILDNIQDVTPAAKYEELKSVSATGVHQLQNLEAKAVVPMANDPSENNDLYKDITSYKQYKDVDIENDKLRKEFLCLQQSVPSMRSKLGERIDLYRKIHAEYNKIYKLHSTLEKKSMSVSDQKNLLSKVFSESQIKILSGKKKIYWSNDDMAIGYTIRHMSSKRCYVYLSKSLNIPLPALSSIKRWQTLKKGEFVKEENLGKDERNVDSDE